MSEKTELKKIGAKQHKNSGRGTVKGDGTWKDFVVDVKETKKSFTLNQDVWAKITTDAIKSGKDKSPALLVVIGEGSKKVRLLVTEFSIIDELLGDKV